MVTKATGFVVVAADGDGGGGEAVAQVVAVADVGGEDAERRVVVGEQGAEAVLERSPRSRCPVPQASSGLLGSRPGSSRAAIVALRRRRDRGEGNAGALREVDEHLALAAGIVDRDERSGAGPAAGREEEQRARELVERLDADHAVTVEQRLVGEIAAGHRAGVGERRRGGGLGAPELERDDGNVALRGLFERSRESPRDRARSRERGR